MCTINSQIMVWETALSHTCLSNPIELGIGDMPVTGVLNGMARGADLIWYFCLRNTNTCGIRKDLRNTWGGITNIQALVCESFVSTPHVLKCVCVWSGSPFHCCFFKVGWGPCLVCVGNIITVLMGIAPWLHRRSWIALRSNGTIQW